MSSGTVIITGAAGFVGSHLTDRFLSDGWRVVGVDNLITGREENIAHLQENDNFTLIKADASQDPAGYLPADLQPNLVLHFASPASPPVYQAHPIETYLVNSLGTHHWLEWLRKTQPQARFVFASTSEVYGDPEIHPQVESYWGRVNPNGVRSCYDESKRLGETICGVHQRDFGMDVRIVRIFNTYGPRMNPADGRVIPDFAAKILKGEPVVIHGTGEQTRSYCYVSDLVDGIFALATQEGHSGLTVNVGNPEEFTINHTAAEVFKVAQQLGRTSQTELAITYQPLPSDDPTRRRPDISKAQAELGWQPRITFAEGLRLTIESWHSQ